MALKIQITIMDSRDYILEYKNFKPTDQVDILEYVWKHTANLEATKIHIRKWNL